jgi:lysophospholipase L1-like esterase
VLLLLASAAPLSAQSGTRMPTLDEACTPPPAAAASASETATPFRSEGDWAWLCYYHADNRAARQGPAPDVVFMGDSITRNWITIDPAFFSTRRLDRGISGQTSAQMLLRFGPDAIALRPKVIHLLAGTNDIAGNAGALAIESYKANITAMADLAKANGITLVIGAIPPAESFPWRKTVAPVEDIRALNLWLRDLAKARELPFIDYHAALAAPDGAAREGLTRDGVHPVAAGYKIMADLAEPVLAKAVARAHRRAKSR